MKTAKNFIPFRIFFWPPRRAPTAAELLLLELETKVSASLKDKHNASLKKTAHGLTLGLSHKKDRTVKPSTGVIGMVWSGFIVDQCGPGSQNKEPKAFGLI